MKQNRVDRIMAALKEMGLHQMLIVDPMSIYYLTGVYVAPFERFYGLYLREDGHHAFFLNRLFTVPQEVGIEKVWYSDTDPAMEIVAKYLDKDAPLGVDKELKARFLLPLMEMKAAAGFVNASLAVDRTRGVKDEEEQELMRIASDINDKAMAQFKAIVHEGVTEKELADQMLKIDYHTTEYAEKKPFFTLFLIYSSNLPRNSFIRGFSELNTSSGLPSSTIIPLSIKTT